MNKFLYWIPRFLTILFILFLGLFALDTFQGDQSLFKKYIIFGVHLIPNVFLILILILAWTREWIGTIAFTLVGIAYIIMYWDKFPLNANLTITGPLFLIAFLFWLGWTDRKKREKRDEWTFLNGE